MAAPIERNRRDVAGLLSLFVKAGDALARRVNDVSVTRIRRMGGAFAAADDLPPVGSDDAFVAPTGGRER